MDERLEHELRALRQDFASLSATVAGLASDIRAAAAVQPQVATLVDRMSRHEVEDAGLQASLKADVGRLWWLVGVALTLAGGGAGTAALGLLQ